MADYDMCRISQTYGNRHVGFGPAVEFTGRVTLEPLLEMPIGILQPIVEEEEAEAGLVHLEPALGVEDMEVEPIREEDSTVVATRRPIKRRRSDAGLALEKKSSKKFCRRAETASPVHGMKRKRIDSALGRKSKRSCIRTGASQVQSKVVEVSRFIDCSLFLCYVNFLHPNLIYFIVRSISLTIMSRRLSQLPRLRMFLRTSPLRQPTITSSRMFSPRKHPLNSSYEKKWRLRLRQHCGVRWLLCSHLLGPTGYHAVVVGCASALITTCHRSER
jgi:hypothetical protein